MKPRVFVSSVMDGFAEYREAARSAITTVGGEAVLVEDYPSLSASSRTACLDGVASSDALVLIVGERGGWRVPSGKLVVEEEFEEARRTNKPVRLFVRNVPRDEAGQALVSRLSDYVDGLFRKTFDSPDDLNREVQAAVSPLISRSQEPMIDPTLVMAKVSEQNGRNQGNEAIVRFVLAPERGDEVVDVIEIGSQDFKNEVYELGTAGSVRLLSHERAKSAAVGTDTLTVRQDSQGVNRQQASTDDVLIEVNSRGVITVEVNVTGRRANDWQGFGHSTLLEPDIAAGLQRCVAFANAFYQRRDPYKRYDRFLSNVALSNIGHRSLRAEPVTGNSMSIQSHGQNAVVAYDSLRVMNRGQLEAPDREIQNALEMFRRRLRPSNPY